MLRKVFLILMLGAAPFTFAQSLDVESRYERLAHELRCLVCQNQSLAESSADLAGDLKREVKKLIGEGKTDDDIKTFLRTRYGDFILYKPPVQTNTAVLWMGPFAALGLGAIAFFALVRKRNRGAAQVQRENTGALSEDEQRELDDRLK